MQKTGSIIFLLAFLLLGYSGPARAAALAAEQDKIEEGAADPGPSLSPGNGEAAEPPKSAAGRPEIQRTAPPIPAEGFIDLFFGRTSAPGADVTASHTPGCFLFCPPPVTTTVSREVDLDDSDVAGLRVGFWGGGETRYLGLAFEFNTYSHASTGASADHVSVDYATFALMPMFRVPFFPRENLPNGRVQLYGGIVLSFVISGRIDVNLAGLPETVNADAQQGTGTGLLAGMTLSFPGIALFAEFRTMHTSIDFSNADENLFGAEETADLSIDTRQIVYGVRIPF